MKNICILGSTGSIGTQTLDIVREKKELKVVSLAAKSNIDLLARQISEFSPKLVCVYDEACAKELEARIQTESSGLDLKIVSGMEGLIEASILPEVDLVVGAAVGMIGIRPTMEAIIAGKDIALANKETLVCAGHLIMPQIKMRGVKIFPVDSEHSAIFQSLNGEDSKTIEKIILTASGGPFRGYTRGELEKVGIKEALNHPNWHMGKKVTIDSATLANKGLEVMEAKWLFDVPPSKIQVVIQPQSIIHSMVQFIDGAVMAELGAPDMKVPIQYALLGKKRAELDVPRVDFCKLGEITFEEPDTDTFPALKLAYEAIEQGGSMPTVFNAANEKAVALFLREKISFLEISGIIEAEMKMHNPICNPSIDEIIKIGEDIMFG